MPEEETPTDPQLFSDKEVPETAQEWVALAKRTISAAAATQGTHEVLGDIRTELREVKGELKDEKFWRVWLVRSFAVIAAMFIAGGAYIGWSTTVSRSNSHILLECTTPSKGHDIHECWERGVSGQATAINTLNEYNQYIAICARSVSDPEQIPACATERYKKAHP